MSMPPSTTGQSASTHNKEDTTSEFLLQSNVAIMQELLESRKNGSAERTNSSSEKGFQKLPIAIQSFLLAVGSLDLETPIGKITDTGLQLLKMSNKNAMSYLGC
jgi:hypothetical protein